MNRLQKRAWLGLAGMTVCVIVAGAGVRLGMYFNAKGLLPLMTMSIAGLIVFLVSCLRRIPIDAKLDERERKILLGALVLSSSTFVISMFFASFCVFFIAGARNSVPTYTLPALFLAGLFVSQFIESAVILIRCAREQADEQ